jgi:hypothetical protein
MRTLIIGAAILVLSGVTGLGQGDLVIDPASTPLPNPKSSRHQELRLPA